MCLFGAKRYCTWSRIGSCRPLAHLDAGDKGVGLRGPWLAEHVLESGGELVAVERHHPVVVVACPATAARRITLGCINLSWGPRRQCDHAVCQCHPRTVQ